jgi:sulfide:quinone oxidoreductase
MSIDAMEVRMSMTANGKPSIVILGAGLGGTIAAFEIAHAVKEKAAVRVVSDAEHFSFVPSNPWVAVHWRAPEDIRVPLVPVFARKGIDFTAVGAARLNPAENKIALKDGSTIRYDYLVIATGPDLAFDEVPGLGPDGGHTVSICQSGHAMAAAIDFDHLVADPGPIVVGAAQGASCFGPAYEFAMILDTELRRRKLRDHVPITFVTPEPYIGHLGLDGIGDSRSMLETEMRGRNIKWITNTRIASVDAGMIHIEEVGTDGSVSASHKLPFKYSMILPAFRGVPAIKGVEGLTNARGFVIVDKLQRNTAFPNIFALGVCVAIPPVGPTPVPVGVPKTGFMIESMATAIAANLASLVDGRQPTAEPTWNAICLADFGDGGVAFVAQPQIPPRNANWAAKGTWVHYAKVGFEKYFLRKIRKGESETFYEKLVLEAIGVHKLKAPPVEKARAA